MRIPRSIQILFAVAGVLMVASPAMAGWRRRIVVVDPPLIVAPTPYTVPTDYVTQTTYVAAPVAETIIGTAPTPSPIGPTAWITNVGDVIPTSGKYSTVEPAPLGTSAPPLPLPTGYLVEKPFGRTKVVYPRRVYRYNGY